MKELDPTPIYYVYIHCRKDSGEPFYVGKGKGRRAWKKNSRSNRWKSVVKKHGYDVEIAWKNIPEKEAFEWEYHLIFQFKLRGFVLVNFTEGGEGNTRKDQTDKRKQEIRDFFNKNGRFPSGINPEEKQIRILLGNYCSPMSDSFDPVFHTEMVALGYGNHVEENKQDVRDFIKTNGRFPSEVIPAEKKLSTFLRSYCSPSQEGFDPAFRAEMISLGYGRHSKENKQKIRDFIKENRRFPIQRNPEEKLLYCLFRNYCSFTSDSFDSLFRTEMELLGYAENHIEENKQKIRDFRGSNGRFPSQMITEEKQLHALLANYCNSKGGTFDSSFRAEVELLGYGQRKRTKIEKNN